jgi:hypothetical protein
MIPIPLDSELQPLDTIPIKKPEAKQQARLVAALRRCWAPLAIGQRPIIASIPNGGQRDAREACNLKTQGVLPGMPDLIIVAPERRTIFIEMKANDGRLSLGQIEIHRDITAMGHAMIVAFSAEEALAKLRLLEWTN